MNPYDFPELQKDACAIRMKCNNGPTWQAGGSGRGRVLIVRVGVGSAARRLTERRIGYLQAGKGNARTGRAVALVPKRGGPSSAGRQAGPGKRRNQAVDALLWGRVKEPGTPPLARRAWRLEVVRSASSTAIARLPQ